MTETLELATRRAMLAPDTADPEARTVEVIWSTGAPVRRRDLTGGYVERLSLDPAAVNLSRLEGASVLDAHRQTAVRDVLGTVRSATVDGRRGTAVIQFSARPEVAPIWQDVLAGILRHVSVGYSVEEWSEIAENGMRVMTAVRWTPHEISVVPTPADPGARIRMETQLTETNQAALDTAPETRTRATVNAEIRAIARIAGLDQNWIDGQIDSAADADAARRAAFEALATRSAPIIRTERVRVALGDSQDEPALRARQMGEALYARINPRHQPSEPARRYAYATPVELAKELLTLSGESTLASSPASLVTRALHTTSDFPIILGDTVGRVLRDAYQAAPAGVRRLGRQTSARDFRAVNKLMLGEAPLLEKLNEHGEIKAATWAGFVYVALVIKIDEARIKVHRGELVRGTIEEALNAPLDAEADWLSGAARYELSEGRQRMPRIAEAAVAAGAVAGYLRRSVPVKAPRWRRRSGPLKPLARM